MWPRSLTVEDTIQNIIADISCFANINSVEVLKKPSLAVEISWKERQFSKKAEFSIRTNGIFVTYDGIVSTYKDFLASPYMANLPYAAEQFLALVDSCANPIEAKCISADINNPIPVEFKRTISELVLRPSIDSKGNYIDSTALIFIRGQAGLGKTIATRELVRCQAREYLKGPSEFLYFYIDAQGQALSQIDNVISHVVNYFSASFQSNAVKALARNLLLIPIIDGFDELIGSGGFADAFKSLSSFLASLRMQGVVIATGRSTYYDENILNLIAETYSYNDSINYHLIDVELQPWDVNDVKRYMSLECYGKISENNYQKLTRKVEELYANDVLGIVRKPFYAVKIIQKYVNFYKKAGVDNDLQHEVNWTFNDESSLIGSILDDYIDREVDKFKGRDEKPILTREGHIFLLEQLALELWWQERRSIDSDTIITITELALEHFNISPESWPIVIGKVSSYAFFKTSPDGEKEFESQFYYDYFISHAMNTCLLTESELFVKQFLSRSLLNESILNYYKDCSSKYSTEETKNVLEKIIRTSGLTPNGSMVRSNIGALVSVNISGKDIDGLEFNNIEFYGVTIKDCTIRQCVLLNVFANDIKFYNVNFVECDFSNVRFNNIVLTSETKFTRSIFRDGVYFNKLAFDGSTILDTSEIRECIIKQGGIFAGQIRQQKIMNDKQKGVFALLQSFLDKASKRFQFDLNSDYEYSLAPIFADLFWEDLQKLLLDSGVLEQRKHDRAGASQYLYRLLDRSDLILSALQDEEAPNNERLEMFSELFWKIK